MKKMIRVAGAGLAGMSAAFCLAREGYEVEVSDIRNIPGHEVSSYLCALRKQVGDKNPLKEFRHFHIPIRSLDFSSKVIKISPSYEKMIGSRSYYLIEMGQSQGSAEQQLFQQCLNAGVNFKFNSSPTKSEIIATGSTGKKANIFGYGHIYRGLQIDSKATYLIYNNDIAPKGYVFAVTKGGQTTLMAVSFDNKDFPSLKERFIRALETFKPINEMLRHSELICPISGSAYYASDPFTNLQKGDTLYVGEAAGIQDASRGFGIRYAITSGALAAKSIFEEKNYADLVREYYKDEFKKNYDRRKIHNTMTNKEYDKIISMS